MSKNRFDIVSVVGLGYTGLPTAAFIAASGVRVVGVDTDHRRVALINSGTPPFSEPDFETLLADVVKRGNLSAQAETPYAEAYVIAVPTPFDSSHEIDMRYIYAAASNIASQLRGGELIVLESTSPPGTTQRLADHVLELRPDLTLHEHQPNTIYFSHAPERVLPGSIMKEMLTNNRVIGGLTPRAAYITKDLYATFACGEISTTDASTAEMVKLTENTFRDVNIALANELSMVCDKLGINIWHLIDLANQHPRVDLLQPGPGVGGHCVAVDPWFIISAAPEQTRLLRAARTANDAKPEYIVQKVVAAVRKKKEAKVACFGLTFKADVDDLRNSPAIEIIDGLCASLPSTTILATDPHVSELPTNLSVHKNLRLTPVDLALSTADIVLILVAHEEFRAFTHNQLRGKVKIDVVNATIG